MVKNILSAIAIFLFSSFLHAQEDVNPYQIVQDVAQKTFDRIKSEQTNIKSDPETLRVIVEEELLPYIDYKFSALKVLGKHFKKVPKDKLPEYIQVFREYLITTYAVALTYYEDQTVEFEPIRDVGNDKSITVRAVVKDDDSPDIKVAFKVRKNKRTNEWKAYDMVAEGISILSAKRSEFESILRQEGIQKIIDIMKSTIDKPIQLNPQN